MSFRIHPGDYETSGSLSRAPSMARAPSLIRTSSIDTRPSYQPTITPGPTPTPGVECTPTPNPTPMVEREDTAKFKDVHEFDYSYKDIPYQPKITDVERKKELIMELHEKVKNPSAKLGIHIIYANIGTLNNVDHTNGKNSDDLLADLAYAILVDKQELILPLLEEQMADMFHLGQCAQGRSTRLWQLISAIPADKPEENE